METVYVLLFAALIPVFFLPTIVAEKRGIAIGTGLVFFLNLLIGWTGIGWLFLILLAACAKTRAEDNFYAAKQSAQPIFPRAQPPAA